MSSPQPSRVLDAQQRGRSQQPRSHARDSDVPAELRKTLAAGLSLVKQLLCYEQHKASLAVAPRGCVRLSLPVYHPMGEYRRPYVESQSVTCDNNLINTWVENQNICNKYYQTKNSKLVRVIPGLALSTHCARGPQESTTVHSSSALVSIAPFSNTVTGDAISARKRRNKELVGGVCGTDADILQLQWPSGRVAGSEQTQHCAVPTAAPSEPPGSSLFHSFRCTAAKQAR